MFGLVLLFVYVGIFSLVNAEVSTPLPQDIRDAFEKYLSERQRDNIENLLTEEVKSMQIRLKELERMHDDDIQLLTNRLEESEYMRAMEAEAYQNRLEAIENSHEKDVAILNNRLREVENSCANTKENEVLKTNEEAFKIHESKTMLTAKEQNKQTLNTLNDNVQLRDRNPLIRNKSEVHHTHNKHPKDLKRSANLRFNQAKRTSFKTNQRVAPVTDWVAFHAMLETPLPNPSVGHTIPFSDVKTNIGNNEYHPTTGIFTCQKAGIYVFSWSIRIHEADHGVDTELMRNGVIVGFSTAGGGDASLWGFSSATVTLYLNHGDEVWVRVSGVVVGVTIDKMSMLSVFLVHAD
ncbi:uncharacterized protein [Argopecten irradians]|uniref:uncharacterized protein n=1 Tax=Argopecten irradians TaxID=31199 RepID=UPI00372477ED